MADAVARAVGSLLPVQWPVGNAGLGPGLAQATLALIGRGTVHVGPTVSVPPFAGIEGPVPPAIVGFQWVVSGEPGIYQAFTIVMGVDPGSDFLEIEFFTLEISDPNEG